MNCPAHINKVTPDGAVVHIEGTCPASQKAWKLTVPAEGYLMWKHGRHVQHAFPTLNADQREMLITGYLPDAWDAMFEGDDDSLQDRITGWQQRTFVDDQTLAAVQVRLVQEVRELLEEDDLQAKAKEAADIAILLFGLAGLAGFDLLHEVEEKLKVNRARTWEKQADGSWRHK